MGRYLSSFIPPLSMESPHDSPRRRLRVEPPPRPHPPGVMGARRGRTNQGEASGRERPFYPSSFLVTLLDSEAFSAFAWIGTTRLLTSAM